ncbi:MAG TPA: hypothetical protein VGE37_14935 [Archangium sp.]
MKRIALLLALTTALTAHADRWNVGLGLGGGYWFEGAAQFDLHFKVQANLGQVVSLGFRPGILLNVRPGVEVGIPVDAYVRFNVKRVYFDVIGGLAILFGNTYPLRAHVAGGMGVFVWKGFSIGAEAGWLQNGAQLLLRLSFAI